MIAYKLNGKDYRYDRYTANLTDGVLTISQKGNDNEVKIVSDKITIGTHAISGASLIFLDFKTSDPKVNLFINNNVKHSGYIKIISHEGNTIVGEFEVYEMSSMIMINLGRFEIQY